MNEAGLIKPFRETIKSEGIEEVTIDFAEMALDDLSKLVFKDVSDTVLEWPVLSWVAAIGKTGWSIGKAASLRKQLVFIQNLLSSNPSRYPRRVVPRGVTAHVQRGQDKDYRRTEVEVGEQHDDPKRTIKKLLALL